MNSSTLPLQNEYRYWAFISYSAKDRRVAKSLHRGLETYRTPSALAGIPMPTGEARPSRLAPVFLDREELTADANLAERIEVALRESRYLIVVCSRHAAQSKWVNTEIEIFQRLGRAGRILAVIVDGDPGSDSGDACFPPALRGHGQEPLAADLRKTGDGKLNARLKLLARVLEVGFDTLKQRESRRRMMQLEFTLAAALLLVLVFAGMAWYSNQQRLKAVAARQQAENMVEFLLFDLRDKLDPVGRLDILRDVQSKIDDYYKRLGEKISQPHMMRNKAAAYQNDGQRLLAEGDLDKAMTAFLACKSINEHLVKQDPFSPIWQRDLSISIIQVGDILLRQGHLGDAMKAYQSSFETQKSLMDNTPSDPARKRDMAVCHGRLGDAYWSSGDITHALYEYKASLAIREQLAACGDSSETTRRNLAVSQEQVGNIFLAQDELEKAEECFRACLNTRQQLADASPANTLFQRELAIIHDKMGALFYDSSKLTQSLAHYRESFIIRKQLTSRDPTNRIWQRDLSVSHEKIGDLLMAQGQHAEALAEYKACLNMRKLQATTETTSAITKRDLWVAYLKMGELLEYMQDSSSVDYFVQARDALLAMKKEQDALHPHDQDTLASLTEKVAIIQQKHP